MDSFSLNCFVSLADNGTFTAAAAKVGRTQSAISQQIAKLEDELGCRLFNRGRKVELTTEGEVLLGYARRILAIQQEALEYFHQPELQGDVRFGLPEDFASVFLSGVLAEFAREHPLIRLNVECALTLPLLERFRQGEFDLILVKTTRPDDCPNGIEVRTEKLEWVGRELESPDFSGKGFLPLVLSPQPCVYRARALEALEKQGVRWDIVYTSPSFAGTIAAVKAGMGFTVLPHAMVPDGLDIIESPNLPSLQNSHLSLIVRENPTKAISSLADFVVKELRRN